MEVTQASLETTGAQTLATPVINFAGLSFKGLRKDLLLPQPGRLKFIVTVNADFVVTASQNERFAKLISNNFATIDGQITLWLARLFAKPRNAEIEKISGSSFAYDLLRVAEQRQLKVFLLGASEKVNTMALAAIRERYSVSIDGFSPSYCEYPVSEQWAAEVWQRIQEFRPDILFVALGAPKQEFWIEDNMARLEELGVSVAVGCGGTLDFIAGALPRAPLWMQRSGLEGLYRLAVQPSWFRTKRLLRSLLVFPLAFRK